MYLQMIVQGLLVSVDQRRETVGEEEDHECQVNDALVDLRQSVECTNDQCTSTVNIITVDLPDVGAVDGLILSGILLVIDVIDRIISKRREGNGSRQRASELVLPTRENSERRTCSVDYS